MIPKTVEAGTLVLTNPLSAHGLAKAIEGASTVFVLV